MTDVLLRDLAGHDCSPAAFLVHLRLRHRNRSERLKSAVRSHREIADQSGLSKIGVQQALGMLHRRGLVKSKRRHDTATPEHRVVRARERDRMTG